MWNGPKRYIRIFLYDDVEDLRKAASRHYYNFADNRPDRAVGMFSPAPQRLFIDRNDNEIDKTDKHWAGVMRLCTEYLTYEVVTHECVHAAAAIFRMDIKKLIVLGYGAYEREEQFAYLVGNLCDDVIWALRDHLGRTNS